MTDEDEDYRWALQDRDVRGEVGARITAEVEALGVPGTPDDVGGQIGDALSIFGAYAARPVLVPRRFPRLSAYLTGMRQFRNPDGFGPSFSWPTPYDDAWCRGYNRAHDLTFWRYA